MHTCLPMRQNITIFFLMLTQSQSFSYTISFNPSYRRAGTVVWLLFTVHDYAPSVSTGKPSHSYATGSIAQECMVLYLVMESMYAAQVTLLFRANRKDKPDNALRAAKPLLSYISTNKMLPKLWFTGACHITMSTGMNTELISISSLCIPHMKSSCGPPEYLLFSIGYW